MSKNVIITGTSQGIGFELVKLFANAGHKVLALSRNFEPISNLNLNNVTSFSFDLCQPEDYNKVVEFIKTKKNMLLKTKQQTPM